MGEIMKGDRFTQGVGLITKVGLVSRAVLVVGSITLLGAACWNGVGTNTNVGNGNTSVNEHVNTVAGNVNEGVNTNVSANTNTNTNSTGELDTSDWLTYTNEEYGLTFQYPINWYVKQEWLEKGTEGEKYTIFLQNQEKESILFFLTTKDFVSEEGEGDILYLTGEHMTNSIEDLKKRDLPIYKQYNKKTEVGSTFYTITTYTETHLALVTLVENQKKQFQFLSISSPTISIWKSLEVETSVIDNAIKSFESSKSSSQTSNDEYLKLVETVQY